MSKAHKKIIFAMFLISGFCGLLYQVVWVRIAYASFGVITPVLSVVVSVFMLGLSLGSWLGGKWIDSVTNRFRVTALVLYGITESFIGLSAFIVPWMFSFGEVHLLSAGDMDSFIYLMLSALTIGISILPWCILMGFTFPFMMAFIRQIDFRGNATSFSFLYLANVIGAMLGTLVTAIVLIELIGFKNTLLTAAVLNLGIGVTSIVLGFRYSFQAYQSVGTMQSRIDSPQFEVPDQERRLIYILLFATGFVSMSMEIIWVRAFTPVLMTKTYSFAKLLAVYLFATWLGSLYYRKQLVKKNVLSIEKLLSGVIVFSLLPIIMTDPRLQPGSFIVLLSIFPLSATLGYLTPHLIDRFSSGRPHMAGKAYAVNVIGSILGPLFASYVFLPLFGVKKSLLILSAAFLIFFLLYYKKTYMTRDWAAIMTVLALVLFFKGALTNVSYEEMFEMEEGSVVRRDYAATIISVGKGWNRRLLVNGISITRLSPITKNMAHLPLIACRNKPTSGLTICMGMGTTYRSMLSWNIESTVVELVPSIKDAFGYYFADADTIMSNPKGQIVIDDGRRFLKRTSKKFDVITIDPPPPVEAEGSSLLYSEDFYDLVKQHLKPGGVLHNWFPSGEEKILNAMARSLSNKFEHIRVFKSYSNWGFHFLASTTPISLPDAAYVLSKMPPSAQRDLVEWFKQKDVYTYIDHMLKYELPLELVLNPDTRISITDDKPFNEYYLLRRFLDRQNGTFREVN